MSVEQTTRSPTDTVLGMWRALSARDWDAVQTFLSDDCIYLDVPVGPVAAAKGPEDIVKRLKIGLAPLAGYQNFDGLLVADGEHVMYEHSEQWDWASGESATLRFVTVHRVVGEVITVWKDYWNMSALTDHAPPTWLADFATADMSWMYDATGEV
ncbi:limonene-1,2-epoxide hydrolase [Mycobacterium sp. MS1601]|uniref:nuclear transport factor 2 family protein n=1 Tax=Mycobacterium sp. MS1601 TaxID=1936029 RepID=UPI0009792A4D|nr:nuclear transport factor 2 family protein [Mycobacterium sp. MS1601]AQA05379.1 limonene-1,2-epoxide hydrolase [Mycobacterium sp. MS1601]